MHPKLALAIEPGTENPRHRNHPSATTRPFSVGLARVSSLLPTPANPGAPALRSDAPGWLARPATESAAGLTHERPAIRSGRPAGVWFAKLPVSWKQLDPFDGGWIPSRSLALDAEEEDTQVDVWYDPRDPGRRFTVVTDLGLGGVEWFPECIGEDITQALADSPTARLSAWETAFHLDVCRRFGPYRIDGVVLAPHQGTDATFRSVTFAVSLPESEFSLAASIVNSVIVVGPPSRRHLRPASAPLSERAATARRQATGVVAP